MAQRIDNLCSTHQRDATPGHRCDVCARLRAERSVMRRTVQALISAGYYVSVDNGEEVEILDSQALNKIMAVCFQTDEEHVYVRREATGAKTGWDHFVFFVYGNSGAECINDYSVSLEPVLAPVMAYMDTLEH